MKDSFIYHICTASSWESQNNNSEYIHDSLGKEKFIHCSAENQIEGVLERYFEGILDLIILTIDCSKLTSNLKYEKAPNGEYFPHVYGPINDGAIVSTKKIRSSIKD